MAKGDGYLSVAIKSVMTKDETKELYESVRDRLAKMSTAQMNKMFLGGLAPATSAATSSFTGLRAVLEADKWKFGTVHRNKITDERVMVVGYRLVTGLSDAARGHDWRNVADTVDDWFNYWDVEP